MPLSHRRPLERARLGRAALLIIAIGMTVGSGAPSSGTTPMSNASVTLAIESVAGPRSEVAAARAAPSAATTRLDGRSELPTEPPSYATAANGPSAVIDPLAVEQGELTVRWLERDGLGLGMVRRSLRVEQAAATPTGCADFTDGQGILLDGGTSGQGAVTLGQPPSEGCVRVSLALTDRLGRTAVTSSQPYRVQPPVPAAKAKPDAPRWTGKFNLYRANTFVTQKTFRWCVAASVQMMVNIVRHRTDRSRATQARMIAYAQRWDDGPYGEEGGTDVTGWINALRHYGAGRYRAVGATSAAKALRVAATAMAQTGRPAGILVMEGRHAWVLHGFESTTDPRRNRRANITAVRVSGPLYPVQQRGGYDPRPNTRFTAQRLARYFTPTIVGSRVGRYVVVIPTH